MSGSVCLSVYTHTCNDTSYSQHTCTTVSVITPPTIGEQSIEMSVSVCLSVDLCVCLSVRDHISVTTHLRSSPNFLSVLPTAEAQSSSDGVLISYVFPVLWMTFICT